MSNLLNVDPAKQWEWHEAHRDMAKNQYRTSYTDMVHFREVHVKSDYPSGYGGHIPSIRHDALHRNTAFDRQQVLRRNDPSRDAHPSFRDQISGIPTWCAKPQGARKNPSYGVVPHDGTTTNIISPWAVLKSVRPVPSHRNVPTTLARTRSLPTLGASLTRQPAVNMGASPIEGASSMSGQLKMPQEVPSESPGGGKIQRTVSMANVEANQQRMPSEQEMLMDEMYGQGQAVEMMDQMPSEETGYF